MFLDEKTKDQGGEFFVGRDEKQRNYKLVVRPAVEVVESMRNRKPTPTGFELSLGEFIQQF